MMMMKKYVFGALLSSVLATSSWAVDVATASLPAAVTDRKLTIGDRSLRLPTGDWHLISKLEGASTGLGGISKKSTTFQAYAVRIVNGQWRGSVFFRGPTSSAQVNGWNVEPCKDDSNLFKDDFNSGFTFPECLLVKKRASHLNNATGPLYQDAVAWFKQNKIQLPVGGVYEVSYFRFASNIYGTVIVFLPQSQTAGDEPIIAWAQGLPERIRPMAEGRSNDATLPELPVKE
jgi:hypothetical protein